MLAYDLHLSQFHLHIGVIVGKTATQHRQLEFKCFQLLVERPERGRGACRHAWRWVNTCRHQLFHFDRQRELLPAGGLHFNPRRRQVALHLRIFFAQRLDLPRNIDEMVLLLVGLQSMLRLCQFAIRLLGFIGRNSKLCWAESMPSDLTAAFNSSINARAIGIGAPRIGILETDDQFAVFPGPAEQMPGEIGFRRTG